MTDRLVVTVYSPPEQPGVPPCFKCRATKRLMDKLGIQYVEEPITDEVRAAAAELGLAVSPIVCASVDGVETYWGDHRPDKIAALVA